MSSGLKYVTLDTEMGWVGILGSDRGLLHLTLPQSSPQAAQELLGDRAAQAVWSPSSFSNLIERLRAYFGGYRVSFPDQLDLSGASAFQKQVWQWVRLIPYGETRSYSWVAGQIKKPGAARAVGQALGQNPLPVIIPCHRVVKNNGELGGFGGGVEMKQRLLKMETASGH